MRSKTHYLLTCLSLCSMFSLCGEENIADASTQKASPSPASAVSAPAPAPAQVAVAKPTPSVQEALEARVGLLAQKFDEMQKHFQKLEKSSDTGSLQASINSIGKDLNSLQTQLAQLQQQAPSSNEAVKKLSSDLKEVQSQMFVMEKKLQDTPSKIATDRLTAQVKDMQAQVTNMKQEERKGKNEKVVLTPALTRGTVGLFVDGEYLCWKPKQGGMEYAVVAQTAPLIGASTQLLGAKEEKIQFNWSSGYRVGGGYHFPFDDWLIGVSYTSFNTKATSARSTLSNTSYSIFPLLVYQAADLVAVEQANASWKLKYNTIDGDLGRDFYVSKHLSFCPYVGVKQAWISQNMTTDYSAGTTVGGTLNLAPGSIYRVNVKNNFHGFGLRAGVGSHWNWIWGFSFFGNAAAAVLYGQFDRHQEQYIQSSSSSTQYVDLRGNVERAAPMTQLQLGVAWDQDLLDSALHFGINLGYENQYWWGQNQMARFSTGGVVPFPNYVTAPDDLSFQGLTLAVRLDF